MSRQVKEIISVDISDYLINPIDINVVEQLDESKLLQTPIDSISQLFKEVILSQQTMLSMYAYRFNECLSVPDQIAINNFSSAILAKNNNYSLEQLLNNVKVFYELYEENLKSGKVTRVDSIGDKITSIH